MLAAKARPDPHGLAEQVFAAVTKNDYCEFDNLIPTILPALGKAGTSHDDLDDFRGLGWDGPDTDWETIYINALDATGRAADAQRIRWAAFEERLSVKRLRAYLKALPDFDDVLADVSSGARLKCSALKAVMRARIISISVLLAMNAASALLLSGSFCVGVTPCWWRHIALSQYRTKRIS